MPNVKVSKTVKKTTLKKLSAAKSKSSTHGNMGKYLAITIAYKYI